MAANIETAGPAGPAGPAVQRGWQSPLVPFFLGMPALIRGIDRVGDGHLLSGWLMLAGGSAMMGSAVWMWLSRARASAK